MNTTYFKNLIMGNVFKTNTSYSLPSKYYIGLSSTQPNADGSGVKEPSASGTGYSRVELSSLSSPVDGKIVNQSEIQFAESQSAWFPSATPALYYVVYDAKSGGNLLMYNQLTASRIIESNTIATIKAESLTLELADYPSAAATSF